MVLPVRIELTTSALPRMRSTTELRQHVVRKVAPMAAASAPVNPACRSRTRAPCGADDWQKQGARGAARGGAAGEPAAEEGPVTNDLGIRHREKGPDVILACLA